MELGLQGWKRVRYLRPTIWLAGMGLVLWATDDARATSILFQDTFSTIGTKLNTDAWTTVTGPASYIPRTQLADWVTPGGVGQFVVGPGGAQLTLNTWNPTGFSLYGTQAETLQSFQPTATSTIYFDTRLQLTSLQPGLVYGMYLYGCAPSLCANEHDEIDIELVTNALQPGNPPQVELNRYANEPLGAGNGAFANLPNGFDPLAVHDWTIGWSPGEIDYFVDGILLASENTHVPQGPMQADEIAWGPDTDWAAAYSVSLQPVTTSGQNQAFEALLTSVTVSENTAPEPSSGALTLAGMVFAAMLLMIRIRKRAQ